MGGGPKARKKVKAGAKKKTKVVGKKAGVSNGDDGKLQLADILRICKDSFLFNMNDFCRLFCTSKQIGESLFGANISLQIDGKDDLRGRPSERVTFPLRHFPKCITKLKPKVVEFIGHLEAKNRQQLVEFAPSLRKFKVEWGGKGDQDGVFLDCLEGWCTDQGSQRERKAFAKALPRIIEKMKNLQLLELEVDYEDSFSASTLELSLLESLTYAKISYSTEFFDGEQPMLFSVNLPATFSSLKSLLLCHVPLPKTFVPPPSLTLLSLREVNIHKLNLQRSSALEMLEMRTVPNSSDVDFSIQGFHGLTALKHLKFEAVTAELDFSFAPSVFSSLEHLHLQDVSNVRGLSELPPALKHLCLIDVWGQESLNPEAVCIETQDLDDLVTLCPRGLPSQLKFLCLEAILVDHVVLPSDVQDLRICVGSSECAHSEQWTDSMFQFPQLEHLELTERRVFHNDPELPIFDDGKFLMGTWSNIIALTISDIDRLQKVQCPHGLKKLTLETLENLISVDLNEDLEELDIQRCSYKGQLILPRNIKKVRLQGTGEKCSASPMSYQTRNVLHCLIFDGCNPGKIYLGEYIDVYAGDFHVETIICRNGSPKYLGKIIKAELAAEGACYIDEFGYGYSDGCERTDSERIPFDEQWM